MTKDDMNQYRLEKIETVAPNGEVHVRMNYVRRNSIYTTGSSILKGESTMQENINEPSSDIDSGREVSSGWREKRKRDLELSYSEKESQPDDLLEEKSRDDMIEEAAHALMKGFHQNLSKEGGALQREDRKSDSSINLPDADHAKVRIHPELIVIVIENILNFEKKDEDGCEERERETKYVEQGDIWYSKQEISEMRKQSALEEYQDDLKSGQDFMKSLSHTESSRKDEEMKKTIASLLSSKHTSWEERIKSPAKSGKKTWDSRKARTGSMETFFMGEEGFATFEDEAEAEEDRSWEVEEKRRRRRRKSDMRCTFNPTPRNRSRRVTRVALTEDNDGYEDVEVIGDMNALNGALADVTLEKIMNEAKAETVAAILAVEAMDFGDE